MRSGDLRALARSLAQPVIYLGVGMLVVIYCTTAYLLVADRNANYEAAERQAENLARVFDESLLRHAPRTSMQGSCSCEPHIERNPANFDLTRWVSHPSISNGRWSSSRFSMLVVAWFIPAYPDQAPSADDRSGRE